jgi:molecular chaperone DnaK (HSP70)
VNRWDGLGIQQTSGKVPTRILYTGDKIKWGFDISPEEKPIEWFKLLLLQPKDMKQPFVDDKIKDFSYIEDARKELKRLNKTAEDVTADYLKLLWKHILADIKREVGDSAVDSQPFRVVMTYPAIWPLYAQGRLTQAATMAGIKDARDCGETILKLCAEPEAAALAVMEDGEGAPVDVRI